MSKQNKHEDIYEGIKKKKEGTLLKTARSS